MAYTDFTLELAEERLGVRVAFGDLFANLTPLPVPAWLSETLERGRQSAVFLTEKARSEFIVAPVLLACREFVTGELAIFSGQRLDVDASRGLVGECDYLVARSEPIPRLRAPLMAVMEAKRGDIELGLGQLVAQMVAARLFNERAGTGPTRMYGVITTGDDWQFLRLENNTVTMPQQRLYLSNLGNVLAALKAAVTSQVN